MKHRCVKERKFWLPGFVFLFPRCFQKHRSFSQHTSTANFLEYYSRPIYEKRMMAKMKALVLHKISYFAIMLPLTVTKCWFMFYLSTTRVSMQYHPWYIIFDIQRIFLEKKTDIPRIFLEHECTFFGEMSRFMTQSTSFMTSLQHLIHFHILLNSCLSVLEITKLNKSDVER